MRFLDWKVSSINKLINTYRHEIDFLEEMKHKFIDNIVINGLKTTLLVQNDDIRWKINYPIYWKIKRIKEFFTFRKGLSITKADLKNTGIAVINYGQIHSKINTGIGLNEDLIRYVSEVYLSTNQNALVEKGDFIFADTSEDLAGCGNCAYINWDATIFAGYHSIIAHPINTVNSDYLAYLFKSTPWRSQIQKKVNGAKVYSITQKILKDTLILIPPVDEQKKIVHQLNEKCLQLNKIINRNDEKISNLYDLKKRLIADAVTGKIDVRGIKIPEYEFVDEIADPIADDTEADESNMEQEDC